MGLTLMIITAAVIFFFVWYKERKELHMLQTAGYDIWHPTKMKGFCVLWNWRARKMAIHRYWHWESLEIPFDELRGHRLVVDRQTHHKRSVRGTVGRALIGGLILGPVGAGIGAFTEPVREVNTARFATLTLLTRLPHAPALEMPVFGLKTPLNARQRYMRSAIYVTDVIDAILAQ